MAYTFKESLGALQKMSALKKALIVFFSLLFIVVVVEQPGGGDKDRKNNLYFIPKFSAVDVQRVVIDNPSFGDPIVLNRTEGLWLLANGRAFPADQSLVQDFLDAIYSLKQGAMVSKNPERMSIFSVDEEHGVHVHAFDQKRRTTADFFAGDSIPKGQYLRHSGSFEVYQTIPTLIPYLSTSADGWKDKTLISFNEKKAKRIAIKGPEGEQIMERGDKGQWLVVQPEEYDADPLALRTFFDQMVALKADSFADSSLGSQVNFQNPDYKISVRLDDDSLSVVYFIKAEEGNYFAKTGETDFIYLVSDDFISKLFGLQFKPSSD